MNPEGGAPALFTLMENEEKEEGDTWIIVDALLGITQVIGGNTIMQFNSATVGLKWGTRMAGNQELSARVELYQQSGDTEAADLDALITQIGYTFYF